MKACFYDLKNEMVESGTVRWVSAEHLPQRICKKLCGCGRKIEGLAIEDNIKLF